jgi:hypothetical protein
MEVCDGEGVFTLVDDFGRILQDTAYRFVIRRNPMLIGIG